MTLKLFSRLRDLVKLTIVTRRRKSVTRIIRTVAENDSIESDDIQFDKYAKVYSGESKSEIVYEDYGFVVIAENRKNNSSKEVYIAFIRQAK